MKKHIWKILFWLCIVVCIIGASWLVFQYVKKSKEEDAYKKVQTQVVLKKEDTPEEPEEKEKVVIPIDFAKLKEINEDIYAWIEIPDTNINYPIVQSPEDDSYYLTHLFDKTESELGAIYTERINAKDFSDFNTVIYGHNAKAAFRNIHQYEDPQFFEDHDEIIIYTETEKKVYKVFAAVVFDDRHILYNFDNNNIEERKEFLQSIYESRNMKNQIRNDVTVDENSNIITLSTCIKGQRHNRFIVEAVEIVE